MKRTALTALLIAAVVAAGLAWFLHTFERQEEVQRVGRSAAAVRNHMLAAERLLASLGLATTTSPTLVQEPPADQALILVSPRSYFGWRRSSKLLAWVRRGGHLIIPPGRPAHDEEDYLLEEVGASAFGPGRIPLRMAEGGGRGGGMQPQGSRGTRPEPSGEYTVRLPGRSRRLDVARYTDQYLVDRDDGAKYAATDGSRGARILHYRLGEGHITVLSESEPFHNDMIGTAQHAELLWQLVHLGGKPAGVRIVLSDDMPGILALIVAHGWAALAAALVLLVLWLWRVGSRFGPLLPNASPARRSLREHLDAGGDFIWRRNAGHALLHAVRAELRSCIRRRHPELVQTPLEDSIERLATLTGTPASRLQVAVLEHNIRDPQSFTRAMRDLQKLAQKL